MKQFDPRLCCLYLGIFFLSQLTHAQDCSPQFSDLDNVNSYYAHISGQGNSLKSQLHDLIDDHLDRGYSCVWDMLREMDEDPNNSDAVIGFYTRRSILKSDRDYGMNTPDVWNREHVWARSHGVDRNTVAYADIHHIRATDKSTNADRASKDFAQGGFQHNECSECLYTAVSWEPPDEVKGDTARMMFYMAVRYEGDDGIPDLMLVDAIGSSGTHFGDLCDLVQWHIDDPVSVAENERNNAAYRYQGNRNPFIDRQDYVLSIWGTACQLDAPDSTIDETDQSIPFMPLWTFVALFVLLLSFGHRPSNNKASNA